MNLIERLGTAKTNWLAGRELDRKDCADTKLWVPSALALVKAGIYRAITAIIQLEGGGLHADIGCGQGLQLEALDEHTPDSILIGVDRNRTMIEAATNFLSLTPKGASKHFRRRLSQGQSGTQVCYEPDRGLKRLAKQGLTPADPIRLIGDDMQNLTVLKALLNGRLLDSASIMLPGMAYASVFSASAEIRSTVEIVNRMQGGAGALDFIKWTVVREACQQLVGLIKPGGRLITAETMVLLEQPSFEDMLQTYYHQIGDALAHFTPEHFDFIDLPAETTQGQGLSWTPQGASTLDVSKIQQKVGLTVATRN
jgi:hypothetical protein